jgi:hypothetical protein
MPLNIKRASAADTKLNLLVYGEAGIGKTTLLTQANDHPAMSPALVINLEGGLLSVANRGDVDYLDASSSQEVEEIIVAVKAQSAEVAHYKTLIVDSATELAALILSEWVERNVARAQRSGKRMEHSRDDVQREDYNGATTQGRRLFSWFRDLPIHTLMTGLPKLKYNDNGTLIGAEPRFTAALGSSVLGMMDMVWFMYRDAEGIPNALTQPSGDFYAKTRPPLFAAEVGNVIADPRLPDILDTLIRTEAPDVAEQNVA